MEYPKIETLYNRSKETFKVIEGELRLPEFGLVRDWLVTEKIDGTNVRVRWTPGERPLFMGRHENAQMHTNLIGHLNETFTEEKIAASFDADVTEVWLYGEGYGAGIQKGGGAYNPNKTFRLFDVRVGQWWLNWDDVCDVAEKLGIKTVPAWGMQTIAEVVEIVRGDCWSGVAHEETGTTHHAEGVVCRTDPLLFTRYGTRLMFKLKASDFAVEKAAAA